MNIRFTSSLTPEDENTIAPALLKAVAGILDLLPIAYVIRVDTSDANVYQHTGGGRLQEADGGRLRESGVASIRASRVV